MFWDDNADALLIKFWNEGASLKDVATALNEAGYAVSRSAVSGRRARLPREAFNRTTATFLPTKTIGSKPAARPNRPLPPPPQRSKPMTEKKVTLTDLETMMTLHEGIDYLDQTLNGCKAILDRPRGGPWMLRPVCGLPRCDGSPYCRWHFKMYSQPSIQRRANG